MPLELQPNGAEKPRAIGPPSVRLEKPRAIGAPAERRGKTKNC